MKFRPEFSQMAVDAVIAAQTDAALAGHYSISAERLVLGILKQPAPGVVHILKEAGISSKQIQAAVLARIEDSNCRPIKPEIVTLDGSVKRVLDYALDESRRHGYTQIRPEHLLIGILRDEPGGAVDAFNEIGLDLEFARHAAARFRAREMTGTSQALRKSRARRRFEWTAPEPAKEELPACAIGRFTDPAAASAWLNIMAAGGFRFSRASTTHGELWLMVARSADGGRTTEDG
ncbi:MAG TPA: Clp protease N-terminal domain-containing protein [Armatimonadota bacterium]|nr:Clp protease N-terminal domain-containing protein [Armatimonadota bacterium]